MDAAAAARIRAQYRDELPGDGDRHGDRRSAGPGADFAAAAGTRRLMVRHAVLPQLAVAGAAVLLHAAVAVRDASRRPDHSAARLGQIHHRPRTAGNGERLRTGARRSALDPLYAMGSGGVTGDVATADVDHG